MLTAVSPSIADGPGADVMALRVSGAPGEYTFDVTIRSPDRGCGQYANWWEVLDSEGRVLYRRILAHSHVDEQPFTRSGGPVRVDPKTPLWIRAHMHPQGYRGQILHGTVATGFRPTPRVPAGAEKSAGIQPECAF